MVATQDRKPLGQLLLNRGLIRPEQLDRALLEQRRSKHEKLLGEILIEQQGCTEGQVLEVLALTYGVPYARVSPRLTDPQAVAALPREFLQRHRVLPLFLVEGVLTVAVSEPANLFLIEELERVTGCTVQIVAAASRDIESTLQAYLPAERLFVVDDLLEEVKPEEFSLLDSSSGASAAGGKPALVDPAVTKLINYCIYNALRDGATDIHFEPGDAELRVRCRIDGRLVERLRPPHRLHAPVVARVKAMAGLDPAQVKLPQEGLLRLLADNRKASLRVSTVPGRAGEKLVIRLAGEERGPTRLEKLGFAYESLKQLRKLFTQPGGLLLVTGPAGSGKRATLNSILQEMNAPDRNLCTVEDSIQHTLPGVNQFQTDEKAGFGFAAALRSLLPQEPDVLMSGDVPDAATAVLLAQAASAGRLVLAALHAPDAASGVTRLSHLGVEPYLLGSALTGVLSQRLVRKLCASCKESYEPRLAEKRQIEKVAPGPVPLLFRPKGCPRCQNLGYTGRIGIQELLVIDDNLRERISGGVSLPDLRDLAARAGMKPLRADAMEKVKSGITTLDEVTRTLA